MRQSIKTLWINILLILARIFFRNKDILSRALLNRIAKSANTNRYGTRTDRQLSIINAMRVLRNHEIDFGVKDVSIADSGSYLVRIDGRWVQAGHAAISVGTIIIDLEFQQWLDENEAVLRGSGDEIE